jgi:hypothetical protein
VVEEIRDFLEWGCGRLGADQQFRVWEFGGRGIDTRGSFIFCLPSGRFLVRFRLRLGLLSPSRFPKAVTVGCEGDSVTAWGEGLGFGGEVVVSLTTRPPRTTWFQPAPDPSAQQMAWPYGL